MQIWRKTKRKIGEDILGLEEDSDGRHVLRQLMNRGQEILHIPGKPRDALGNNQVYLSCRFDTIKR